MSSPPLTPTSPRHRRRPSSLSLQSGRHSLSRRSSAAYSPVTSRLGSSHGPGSNSLAQEFAELNGGEGLGSLADELGGWDDGIDGDEEGEYVDGYPYESNEFIGAERERDSGIDVASSPPAEKMGTRTMTDNTSNGMLSPESAMKKRGYGHQRKASDYDGSEYGSESDFEATELVSATLEARMAAVEAMARRGLEENGSEGDRIVPRFTESLRELGPQTGVETGVTRLTTAHSSLSTHLTHQTRLIQQLSSTLLSPLAPPLHPDIIADLLPHIDTTLTQTLPHISPSTQAPYHLHRLISLTNDIIQSLSHINDSLHMARQTSLTANRRLRAVKEVLAEWKSEWEEREDGVKCIERGDWDCKLRERQCAAECREVMRGFEDVCGVWRERIVEGHGGAGGGVEVSAG